MRLALTSEKGLAPFRFLCGVLAGGVGVLGAWLLATEVSRPSRVVGFGERPSATSVTPERARRAAAIGVVRGQMWADAAMAQAVPLLSAASAGASAPTSFPAETAISDAMTAVAYAPLDARAWLLMAVLPPPGGADAADAAAYLKMSYYVASGAPALMPVRLKAIAAMASFPDEELRDLFRNEIQTVLTMHPALRPALVDAYGGGSAAGRREMEDVTGTTDRNFLPALRGSPPEATR